MHIHTLITIMQPSIKIGTLLKELIAIVWEYVGVDLTTLILLYQAWAKDAEAFDFGDTDWQKLADDCAAFYPPGCEWLYALNPPAVQWARVMYHSIRGGNLSFVTKDRTTALPGTIFTDVFQNTDEYENKLQIPLSWHELFLIAAIDSANSAIFEWIKTVVPADGALYLGNVAAHAEGRRFLLEDIRDFYDVIGFFKDLYRPLRTAWFIGNVEAVKKVLLSGNMIYAAIFHNFAVAWKNEYATRSPRITTLVYKYLKRDFSAAQIMRGTIDGRDPHYWKEFAVFIIRKEGAGIVRRFREYISPQNFADLAQWASSVIANEDIFWNEIGM